MSGFVIAIILSAALLHAVWNAIVKTAVDRTTTLGLVALGHVVPGAVLVVLLPLPSAESFLYIGLSTVVHFGYFYLLGRAYEQQGRPDYAMATSAWSTRLHAALCRCWSRSGRGCCWERYCPWRSGWGSA